MHYRAVPFFKPPLPQPLSLYRDSSNVFGFFQTFVRGLYLPKTGLRRKARAGLGGWKSRGRGKRYTALQVRVVLVGEGLLCGGLHLLAVPLHLLVVDLHLGGSESGGGDELL